MNRPVAWQPFVSFTSDYERTLERLAVDLPDPLWRFISSVNLKSVRWSNKASVAILRGTMQAVLEPRSALMTNTRSA